MKITEVKIRLVRNKSLVGYADIVFNNSYKVCDIGIHRQIDGEQSYRLTFPQKVLSNGHKMVRHHPINRRTTEMIVAAISTEMDKLEKELSDDQWEVQYGD